MTKRTPTEKTIPAAPDAAQQTALHDNEQTGRSKASEHSNAFEFRFWELGELEGGKQGLEVGHDGSPVDMFVLDEVSYEAFKDGQPHQYIGGFAMTAARHLFQIPFKGTWYLVTRQIKPEDRYDIAYRLISFN